MTSMNLSDLYSQYKKEDEIAVLEPGDYVLEVTRCGKRDNGVMPTYRVVEGPHAGKTVMAGGFFLTDRSRSIFFRNINGFGLGEDFFAMNPSFEDLANALVGRVVRVTLKKRDWQGQDRNEIPIGAIKLVGAATPTGAAPAAPPAAAAPPAPPATPAPAPAAPQATDASAAPPEQPPVPAPGPTPPTVGDGPTF